jgi:HK97 family phage portal protein
MAVEQDTRRGWFRRRRGEHEDRALTRATVPAIFLPRSASGEPVTTRNALGLVDVWACVRVLAQTAATLPLHAYRRGAQGRERVHAERLEHPAPGMPQGCFIAWAVTCLALHGEALIGKYRRDDGVAMLSLLDPDRVGVEVALDGEPVYTYADRDGQPLVLFRRDVIHARLMTLDGIRGVSPIAQCRDALGLAGALAKHAGESASGGYRPDGVVTVREGPGADDVAENLRKKWSERHSTPGKTAFVTGEVTYTPISIPARDAEFVEQRRLSTVECCRIFGVHPWMVAAPSGDSLTYATVEGQAQAFVTFGLAPYLAALEQAITLDGEVLPPGDTYCEFALDALLRPDSATRAQVYTAALNPDTGWMRRDEIRALENLDRENA